RHAGKLLKNVGETIKAGTSIATVGETGELSQAHILIELRYKNQPVDPALYIEF
ncbi:MAG: M23 family metallopeptidase, partial [Bacteroidales bacterium]|nr:M23 family metallopeptidase [Bacteroidales bacterium]